MPAANTISDVVANNRTCDNTNNKVKVERCVELLEHAGECGGRAECVDGQHCYRACRVLLHHRACAAQHCSVCRQLKPLCHLHARHCQKKVKSCNMPFCPNARVVRSCVTLMARPGTADTLAAQPVNLVKSADRRKCLSAEDRKRVTRISDDDLSITPHHSKIKRHLPDKNLPYSSTYCKMLASKKITTPESIFLWKAKVSVVPMK